jgi:hypothetical protein
MPMSNLQKCIHHPNALNPCPPEWSRRECDAQLGDAQLGHPPKNAGAETGPCSNDGIAKREHPGFKAGLNAGTYVSW